MLTCIIPCYNEEGSLPFFYDEISNILETEGYSYELILWMTVRQITHYKNYTTLQLFD